MPDLTSEVQAAIEESNKVTIKVREDLDKFEKKWGEYDPENFDFNAGGEAKERVAKLETAFEESCKLVEQYHEANERQQKAIEEMEAKLQQWARSGVPAKEATGHDDYDQAYYKYLRGGVHEGQREYYREQFKLSDEQVKALDTGYKEDKADWTEFEGEAGWVQTKAISTDSGETGGYAMPAPQRGALVEKLIEFSPMIDLANVETISIGDTFEQEAEGDQNFVASWTNERATRAETQTGHLRRVTITAHEAYANPYISQKALDDPARDLAAWTNNRLARRFGVLFGAAFVNGDADGKPEGIAANSVAKAAYVASGHATELTADGLIDIYIDLPEFYANRASWVFRRATLGLIWKLKNGAGDYLFSPGNAAVPPTVLNAPYREMIDMPAVAANAYAVGFGAWEDAYTIVRRQEFRQLRDPYTQWPMVSFKTTARIGGEVVLPEAYRLQKVAAS